MLEVMNRTDWRDYCGTRLCNVSRAPSRHRHTNTRGESLVVSWTHDGPSSSCNAYTHPRCVYRAKRDMFTVCLQRRPEIMFAYSVHYRNAFLGFPRHARALARVYRKRLVHRSRLQRQRLLLLEHFFLFSSFLSERDLPRHRGRETPRRRAYTRSRATRSTAETRASSSRECNLNSVLYTLADFCRHRNVTWPVRDFPRLAPSYPVVDTPRKWDVATRIHFARNPSPSRESNRDVIARKKRRKRNAKLNGERL